MPRNVPTCPIWKSRLKYATQLRLDCHEGAIMSMCDPTSYAKSIADLRRITRRHFFSECGVGLGKMALASLVLGGWNQLLAQTAPATKTFKGLHFPARAKHVIYLFQAGAPSQLDLFDYKPALTKYDAQPVPAEFVKDQRYAFIEKNAALMSARYKFAKHGDSGAEISEMLPHLAKVVDDIAIVKSMHTDQFNHAPAQIFTNTGSAQLGRPSIGSWVSYGLGTENADLPAFVVLQSGKGVSGGTANWGCGFLPTSHQGVMFRSQGDAILAVANPQGIDAAMQRDSLDLIRDLNARRQAAVNDPEISTRIG